VNAGRMNRRLRLEVRTRTQSSSTGQPVDSWAWVADVWASVEPSAGAERLVGQQVREDVTTLIRTRDSSEVAAVTARTHRFTGTRDGVAVEYDLAAVMRVRGAELRCLATERVNA
jgi:SPP1 family predicted phage head-tail adaptor